MRDPTPTGECWCGCGQATSNDAFFVPGHDRRAESAVIKAEFGGIPQFLLAMGYGPGGTKTVTSTGRGYPREDRDR